MMYHYLCI